MPEQIYIGNFPKGQVTDRLPFVIDNSTFPNLFNFYSWRGRVKRKRGTRLLGQMQIQETLDSTLSSGSINLLSGLPATSTLSNQGLSLTVGSNVYTSPSPGNGSLYETVPITGATNANPCVLTANNPFTLGDFVTISGVAGMTQLNGNTYEITHVTSTHITINVNSTAFGSYSSGGNALDITTPQGTVNYATGVVTIVGGAGSGITGTFSYFPGNVSMGQRDFVEATGTLYPLMISFDKTNAYQVNQEATPFFYNVTYYKGTQVPFVWSGQDYQQFWTTNYSGAFWATNGNPGLNFLEGTYSSGSTTDAITFNFKYGLSNFTTLVVGDKLWFNEWAAGGVTINGIVGTVSNVSGAASGNYVVTFVGNQTVSSTGIAQLLTNTIPGQDGIKWYDGDPTSGTGIPASTGLGWVNFAPPLTAATVSIYNTPAALYYLIGAQLILPFKDRLLFFNPTIGTSSGTSIQLQDVVIWSWNGTPYYALPVPTNQTADVKAYYVDQTGLGGYLSAGISQPITTVANNEDVLLVGFAGARGRKTRFVYTGNDLQPFLFYNINSELPSDSTFSAVTLDKGAIDIGVYGIAMTDQQSCQRIDLDIPDSVFQISNLQNGAQRVNAVRDFQKEWIYFCYPANNAFADPSTLDPWKYPTQTLLFNYRDNTWAILYENFTSQGTFRYITGETWATLPYSSWEEWVDPWNSGISSAQFPNIVGGTPQGYVLIKGEGTGEGPSCTIKAIASANMGTATQITSYNHCLASSNPNTQAGDFIYITGMIGATSLNGLIGKVIQVVDANNFIVDLPFPSGTYLGLGQFAKLSHPLMQTKQFNPYWEQGRQVRLSAQKYLMDYTFNAQVTLNVNLSQDPDTAYNTKDNDALVYSQIMYTCPESTNLGLTPFNTNLQMPTAENQYQIWHRFNTSLIGDSVQIGITLSSQETTPGARDAQMYNLDYATSEITVHGIHLTVDRASHLA
jgi:hypothetical protein